MQRLTRLLLSLSLLPLLTLFSASSALAQAGGPQIRITQVDKSQFPQVTVYVSVVNENGEPVGIDPATIQLMENNQAMQPTEIRGGGDVTQTIPVTTMLVMDISGSMAVWWWPGKLAVAVGFIGMALANLYMLLSELFKKKDAS